VPLDRSRSIVVVTTYILSLVVFSVWPGRTPAGPGGWLMCLIAAFGLPTAALAMILIFRRMSQKGPLRANIQRFQRTYDLVIDAAVLFVVALHMTVLSYVLAGRLWLGVVVILLLGGTIIFVGNLLPRIRPGSVLGIRTPWTLRDEGVWRRTHWIGGYVVVLFGLALMAAAVFSFQRTGAMFMGGTAAAVLGLPVASYVIWRRCPAAAGNAEKEKSLPDNPED